MPSATTCDSEKATRRFGVRHLLDTFHENIEKHGFDRLDGIVSVSGEVLDVHQGEFVHFVTLLDAKDDKLVLPARFSKKPEAPQVGHMVHVLGRVSMQNKNLDGAANLFFMADSFKSIGLSRRQKTRREVVARLEAEGGEPLEVQTPIRSLTLVTSQGSKGAEDFEEVLDEAWQTREIERQFVYVKLDSAESVANGMREASKLGNPTVLVRGGGSAQTLAVLNNPPVIEAAHACSRAVPLIVAVGHAADRVDVERFASAAFNTPSEAGRFIRKMAWQEKSSKEPARAEENTKPSAIESKPEQPRKSRQPAWLSYLRWFVVPILAAGGATGGWFAHRAVNDGSAAVTADRLSHFLDHANLALENLFALSLTSVKGLLALVFLVLVAYFFGAIKRGHRS